MITTLWLSEKELIDATHRRTAPAQGRFLKEIGVPFKPRPDGKLLVSRAALERALLGDAPAAAESESNGLKWTVGA